MVREFTSRSFHDALLVSNGLVTFIVASPFSSAPSPPSLTLKPTAGDVAVSSAMSFELMKNLSSMITWNKLRHPQKMYSASRTSAALSILMPEFEHGQHDTLSADLSTSRAGIVAHMSILLYLMSNNLTPWEPDESHDHALRRNDQNVLRMLKVTGWGDLNHLSVLLSTHEPTAQSITERLFAAAVRMRDYDVVQKMLLAGKNPDGLIECTGIVSGRFLTPLQFICASGGTAQEINLLIAHGANLNFSMRDDGRTPLVYAFMAGNETATRAILAHHASVTLECVLEATGVAPDDAEDFSLIEHIIDSYLNQDGRKQRDDTRALEYAVRLNNTPVIRRFLAKGAKLNGLITIHDPGLDFLSQTTLLGLAADEADIETVRLLLHVSTDVDPCFLGPSYISPLALAVERCSFDIIAALLSPDVDNRYADEGEKTLLERAVPKGDVAIV